MKNLTVTLVILVSIGQIVSGQNVISAAGTTAKVPGYDLTWTVGEPVVSTFTQTPYVLTQGFHQPKYYVIPAVGDNKFSGLKITVYPNPVIDNLLIQTDGIEKYDLKYSVMDINGRFLRDGRIEKNLQTVEMQDCTSGIYLLKVSKSDDELLRTFIIIKK